MVAMPRLATTQIHMMSVTRVQLVDSCGWLQNTYSTLAADVAKEEAVLIPPTGIGLGL